MSRWAHTTTVRPSVVPGRRPITFPAVSVRTPSSPSARSRPATQSPVLPRHPSAQESRRRRSASARRSRRERRVGLVLRPAQRVRPQPETLRTNHVRNCLGLTVGRKGGRLPLRGRRVEVQKVESRGPQKPESAAARAWAAVAAPELLADEFVLAQRCDVRVRQADMAQISIVVGDARDSAQDRAKPLGPPQAGGAPRPSRHTHVCGALRRSARTGLGRRVADVKGDFRRHANSARRGSGQPHARTDSMTMTANAMRKNPRHSRGSIDLEAIRAASAAVMAAGS